ncbi:Coproporphyrinogen III oxidase [Mycena galopus ATCC 62051]|nr:Coproporphyrinogen III oxidase [Mycena galopus ATCC 62051]
MADASAKPMRQQAGEYVLKLQDEIVSAFEALDPNAPKFKRDSWIRPEGGSGQSCVGLPFFVAGLSLVIHPRNPTAPTIHANYRYFEITEPASSDSDAGTEPKVLAWWFGADAVHFHTVLKTACDAHGTVFFPAFKKWCDEYFYIPHRAEYRGIGGIFFDDLNAGTHLRLADTETRPRTPAEIFRFLQTLGNAFLPSYLPILSKRHAMPFTPLQRRWQLVRRGRYVEFNLVVDRGTQFGLMTPGARVESILMTLPETVRWEYMTDLGAEGTDEGKLMEVVRNPKEWV